MASFTCIIPEDRECFIPLKLLSKVPLEKGWTQKGKRFSEIDTKAYNVGIIVGEKSGILDIDLDCYEAKALAEIIMPPPSATFDRGSDDSGHYIYVGSSFGPKVALTSPNGMLVELRANGNQTMLPPSLHPNGDALTFTSIHRDTSAVEYETLLKHMSLLAACAEVAQNWVIGVRHNLALAFAGLCNKEGLEPNLAIQIILRICSLTNDAEGEDRLNAIKSTFSRPAFSTQGHKGLVDIIGYDAANRIAARLRAYCGGSNESHVAPLPLHEGTLLEGVHFVDRSELTEARVGAALSAWLEGQALYVFDTKQWMIWNGLHWQFDQKNLILQLAYQFINKVKADLVRQGKHADANNLRAFETRKKLENIVVLASTDRAVEKADFDTNPFLVAAKNPWIDLKTGESVAPNPQILVSKVLAAPYDPSARCPMFLRFLEQIFEENEELIRFVQKSIGYSLTGSTQEQCFFIMIGDGANGKSTFINLINSLWGTYGTTAAPQTLIANGRGSSVGDDLVDLVGARLISVSETEEGQALAEAKIKQMTGGDTLKGRPLYGLHLQFIIIGKLWLGTNSLPQINNTDFGIWRRIMAIPFHKTFAPHEQDKNLRQKLQAELSGILAWAVEGCLAWQQDGLIPPAIVEEQTKEYKTAMDSIAQWVQDQCSISAEQSYPASSLYSEYRNWCYACGRKAQSNTSFKRSLEKLDGVHQVRTARGNQWNGIAPLMAQF